MSTSTVEPHGSSAPAGTTPQKLRIPFAIRFAVLLFLLVAAFLLTLSWGTVSIPLSEVVSILVGEEPHREIWKTIVLDLRLPRAMTASLVGAALGIAGLQMQTVFRNVLADPFILGVSAGASLGVALVIFSGAGASAAFAISGVVGNSTLVVGAAFGAACVLALMLALSAWTRDPIVVLILGVVIGSLVQAAVTVLIYFGDEARTRAFVNWTFGSFQRVTWEEMWIFLPATVFGLLAATLTLRSLNALLLGENYARTMGISILRARAAILGSASLLAGATVAYAGPIAFLGIVVPHLARGMFGTSDHRVLMPASMLLGALLALICGILAEFPRSSITLPINAATALIGAPVVLWVLLRPRRRVWV